MLVTARVQAEQEPILLEYSADAACPSRAEFERMVFERAHSGRPARPEEAARLFTVAIHKTASGVQGSLTVREGNVNLVRQVRGKSCRQLANVLALAAALAIDPAADLAPAQEADVEEPDDAAISSETELTPEQSRLQGSNEGSLPGAPRVEKGPESRVTQDEPHEYELREPSVLYAEVGVGPRLELGATPYPSLGPNVLVGLLSANGRWRAALGGSWLFTPDKRVGAAAAEFRILTANLALCALALQWRNHMSGGPCIHAEVGDFYARGLDIDYRTTVHRTWSTAGAHVHLRIPAGDAWFFAANVGANVLLNRYTFEFNEPETQVFSQLAITGTVNLMAGFLF